MKGTSPSRGVRANAEYGNEVPRWEVRSLINSLQKGKSMAIVHVGIDLAKNDQLNNLKPLAPPVRLSVGPGVECYSMMRSARNRIDGEIVRPSALAVFVLTTNSNFVARSTGMSAGLAPLRILSTKTATRRYNARKSAP